jgi:hypothetical protein
VERRYGFWTAGRPGGGDGVGRVRGGSWSKPVEGIGGKLSSWRAALRWSNVRVWLLMLRSRAQLRIGCGVL